MIDRLEQAFPESYRNGDILMIHGDCIDVMEELGEKEVQLSIVDPPYGIGGSRAVGTYARNATNYSAETDKKWDEKIPEQEYFNKLLCISQNQIIWGGNYISHKVPVSMGWICWYKSDEVKGRDFSEIELAWTSFNEAARHFEEKPFIRNNTRIHPTQKPIQLYKWLLSRYAKPTDIILDTHGGSGSIVIACHDLGFPIIWVEKDADYYRDAVARYKTHALQETLFDAKELTPTQGELI